jgi:hypothetical protein
VLEVLADEHRRTSRGTAPGEQAAVTVTDVTEAETVTVR